MARPYYDHDGITIYHGDCMDILHGLDAESVNCCVTSPPYWRLRDYGVDGQIGLERTPEEYVAKMVAVFREVWRVLRKDGTVWLNLGDSYASGKGTCFNPGGGDLSLGKERKAIGVHPLDRGNRSTLKASGLKPKDLVGIPWRVAFALQADGWWLRQDIIWHKPNPMPESVTDRCTKAHEYIFLLSKSARYYYDAEAVKEPGTGRPIFDNNNSRAVVDTSRNDHGRHNPDLATNRNKRSVWTIATQPYPGAHFATFPPKLIEPCILAGCPIGGVVLDPFMGSGTTMAVAQKHNRKAVGCELNKDYIGLAEKRLAQGVLPIFS
jgi:DNA modification methylase